MQENLELFDDIRPALEANSINKEVDKFKQEIEKILSGEELKALADILAHIPIQDVAKCGNKITSILHYYNK